ncbi:hypothetical protein [Microbispora sp. NPDC049125]|uniref:hypothetical protein n=1 Tax=Microbispora sp. NPDC049125 TaxID=3154929 RepID=UPI0034662395
MNTAAQEAALERIDRACAVAQALEPLRRLLAAAEAEAENAMIFGMRADLSERTLLTRFGPMYSESPPAAANGEELPPPPPSLAGEVWTMHAAASALMTLAHRLRGENLPDQPSRGHIIPEEYVRKVSAKLEEITHDLALMGAALDYAAKP